MIKGIEVKEVQNSKGECVILTPREAAHCVMLQKKFNEEVRNSVGYEVNVTTLYAISKNVIEQKFFEIAPADYMPVRVGNGAWSDNILTYRDFQAAGDFEAGNLNTGASNSTLAEADSAIDSVVNKVINWGKSANWTIMDIAMAARSGNWDVVTSKERSRKRNWDLGIQQIAFLGSSYDTGVKGFLTQSGVTSNTALITQYLSTMDAATFTTFVAGVVGAYRANCNYTAMPNRFTMPELDYNGMAAPYSSGFPNISKMQYLLDAFKMITGRKDFKILPCAYAGEVINNTIIGLNKNRYTLSNYDEDSGAMDIPVDYTNTLQNSINNFQYQNVGYGQYTGYLAYRPAEMLYFDFT